MVPVLKSFNAVSLAFSLFLLQSAVTSAQSTGNARVVNTSESVSSPDSALDDEARALLAAGKDGFLIESVREEVLSLLSESDSCTNWFFSAESSSRDKFRSLHFELDLSGPSEIRRIDGPQPGFYHPYVASTRQDVGPGSTITLNANGAFFRSSAFVRDSARPMDRLSTSSYRSLTVGSYAGGSPEAQLLTVLHEFGHIVDLLPIDADVPSAPFVSIQNTETVLHHCRAQIRAHAKSLHLSETAPKPATMILARSISAPSLNLQAFAQKRSFRELLLRNDGW